MPPVVLLTTPVDTEVLDPTQDGVRNLSPFEPRAMQELLQAQQAVQESSQRAVQFFTPQDRVDFRRLRDAIGALIQRVRTAQRAPAVELRDAIGALIQRVRTAQRAPAVELWHSCVPQLLAAHAVANLLWGFCPGIRESHPGLLINPQPAMSHVIPQLHPGLRNPRAALELRRRAVERGTSPQNLLRTEVFPEAIVLVSSTAATPQRIRLGRHWLKDDHGNVQSVPPVQVSVGVLLRWWRAQVSAAAAAILLDELYPRPTTQTVQLLWREEDALERLAASKSPSARDSAMLTALLQGEETDPADQLHRLLTVASPRARELFILLREGLSIKEAASAIGMSPSTAYVHCHRTRAKLRR